MSFLADPKRRSIALLGGGVLLIFAILGWLQAFNTSHVGFLNLETSGETLAFTALTVLVFLLLMVLSMLLLRNILRLYASPVSYTHLDVYKRQATTWTRLQLSNRVLPLQNPLFSLLTAL